MSWRFGRDTSAAAISTISFSIGLSLSSVILPLLAVASGYSLVAVGVLAAISAVAQLGTRLVIAALMRRFPDWVLVVIAAFLMAASTALVAISTALVPFVICQLLQGASRGAFWTGSQTHVVRGSGSAAQALAKVNFASTIGTLVGPLGAGLLAEWSLTAGLLVSTGTAAIAAIVALWLDRLPPFAPVVNRPAGRLWRRPGVDTGCWSGITTGAWRGLLGSYVPVVLAASQSTATVGVLISAANAAALAGAGWMTRLRDAAMKRLYVPATVIAGLATGGFAFATGQAVLAGVLLAISGAAIGVLQVVGPAIAVDSVPAEERGDVIATTGTFRAIALLATPAAVAGMLGLIAVGPALAVVGVAMFLPALSARRGPHAAQA